jgi:hypothetical protein
VKGSWIQGLDTSYPAFDIHNTMSYTAADVLAAAYGGDTSRVPKYIGFIYNEGEMPASLPPITRNMDLQTLDELCRAINGNMQVVRLSRKPSVGTYASFGMNPDYDPEYELIPIYSDKPTFSRWTIFREGIDVTAEVPVQPTYQENGSIWIVGDSHVSTDEMRQDFVSERPADTTSLAWAVGDGDTGNQITYTATRTRTDIVGYQRVPKTDNSAEDSSESNIEPAERYKGNVVEFSAISRTDRDGIYANDINGGTPYCGPLSDGDFIYRAVLLGDGKDPCGDEPYTVLAMVDLTHANTYRKKPEGYELSLDWRVSFE